PVAFAEFRSAHASYLGEARRDVDPHPTHAHEIALLFFTRSNAAVAARGHPCNTLRIRLLRDVAVESQPVARGIRLFTGGETIAQDRGKVLVHRVLHSIPDILRVDVEVVALGALDPAHSMSSTASENEPVYPGAGLPSTRIICGSFFGRLK